MIFHTSVGICSAAKPSDFSDSVRFLKALPKTGPKRETSEKQPKCRRSLLPYAEVLYFHFSAQLTAQIRTCASEKASAWLWKCKVTILHAWIRLDGMYMMYQMYADSLYRVSVRPHSSLLLLLLLFSYPSRMGLTTAELTVSMCV